MADAKHTTVGALMGTDKRRFTLDLPRAIAEMCGEETVIITEERDGLSGSEMAYWLAFYEIEREKNKR